jgi:oxygen-dependent protoporphyrinogen oxidase
MIDALCRSLPPESIVTNKPVARIHFGKGVYRYDVECEDGSFIPADAVIVALPAPAAARVLEAIGPGLSGCLGKIPYCKSTMVNMVFRKDDLPGSFSGFGFVVPSLEGRCVNAVSLSSQKFAKRAPADQVLIRASVKPGIDDDDELRRQIARDLRDYLGITASPLQLLIFEHQYGLPQYEPGHRALVREIRQQNDYLPGVFLAGNAYEGLGIPDCIASGERAAADLIKHLKDVCAHLDTSSSGSAVMETV